MGREGKRRCSWRWRWKGRGKGRGAGRGRGSGTGRGTRGGVDERWGALLLRLLATPPVVARMDHSLAPLQVARAVEAINDLKLAERAVQEDGGDVQIGLRRERYGCAEGRRWKGSGIGEGEGRERG